MPGALPSQKGLKECRQTARTVNSIPTLFRPQRVGLHRRGKNEKSRCRVVDCKAGLATIAPAPQLAPTFSEPSTSAGVVRSLCSDEFEADFPLAFELIQGPLVRWTSVGQSSPPTAVLVHGILGNRKNMQSFARMLAEGFPSWQVLLVDLRCHGESARMAAASGHTFTHHDVAAAASDVLRTLRALKLFPHVLMGHSFGGKVVMSMASQFSAGQPQLPRPVQVWVLDSLPGDVRSGEDGGKDHPRDLIALLRSIRMPVLNRYVVMDALRDAGFSDGIARWVSTNLRPTPTTTTTPSAGKLLDWTFDLAGIAALYESYERDTLWPLLQAPPQGLKVDFVKAERSTFRWGGPDEALILQLGHRVHTLQDAGHWVHADNPLGLFDLVAPSFGQVDVRLQRRAPASGTGTAAGQ